jgi:hypothetical protein
MIALAQIGVAEFSLRLSDRAGPGDWLVLVTPATMSEQIGDQICKEASIICGQEVKHIKQRQAPESLTNELRASQGATVVSAVDNYSEEEWRRVDLLRSRLQLPSPVGLIMTRVTADAMMRAAPNFASWIGGSVWELDLADGSLSSEDKKQRLEALRAWSKVSEREMLQLAQERQLPPEPEYAEWLLLLGRDDLLGR